MPTTATLMSAAVDRVSARVRSAGVATGFMRWLLVCVGVGGVRVWGRQAASAHSSWGTRSARYGTWGEERRGLRLGGEPRRGSERCAPWGVYVLRAGRPGFRSG